MGEIAINPIHNVHKKYRTMNLVNPYVFAPPVDLSTNTEIGGVAATISTTALLATKLGIDVSRITNFTIVGSDIKCKITGSYVIPAEAFQFNKTPCSFYKDTDYLVSSVGSDSFYYSNIAGVIDFQNATSVSNGFRATPLLIEILLKNCTSVGDSGFAESPNGTRTLKTCYIPNVTSLGSTSGNNSVFAGNCTGLKIYAHPSLATNNSGAPDGDLAYVTANNGTVVYVTNFTAPNPVTTLSVGTIYNTAIQLNFTPPSSTNAIEYYECYANGVLKNTITASGQHVFGLTTSTNYNISVYAVDVFYNKSIVSNVLNQSTTADNPTDSNASAYITASSNSSYSTAINDLFCSLKGANLYPKIHAFYPFLGTTSAQHKWNAKNPLDTDAANRITFNGTANYTNDGYTPNGSTGYGDSHFIPSSSQSVNNNGVTLVSGTNNATANSNVFDLGVFQSTTQTTILSLKNNNTNYEKRVAVNNYLTFSLAGTNESRGIFSAVRQSASIGKLFRNGGLLVSGTSSGTLPSIAIGIGALNQNGSYNGFSNQRFQGVYFHEGLSDAEVSTLNTIIDTFETAVGRKTW